MTDPKDREFYGSDEVAEIFRVHPATVRRWLVGRILRGTKIGRKWLVPVGDVERLRKKIKRGEGLSDPPFEPVSVSVANARYAR